MTRKISGFVLFAVMLITVMVALFSLMLLRTDIENAHLARVNTDVSIATIKAKALIQAWLASNSNEALACGVQPLSPDALLHADDAWWGVNACSMTEGVSFVRDLPWVSSVSVMATQAGWVAAQYQHVTLRYQAAGAAPVLMQALIAAPSSVKVAAIKGKAVVLAGAQQLECLND